MAFSVEEMTQARDILIQLLQDLGSLINVDKSVLQPCHTLQFLGVEPPTRQKRQGYVSVSDSILGKPLISIRELTQFIGRLASTPIAILPPHL